MNTLRKVVSGLCTAGLLLLSSAANAGPVSFSITGVSFTPGTGYGVDTGGNNPESNGTLLDVVFNTSNTFSPQNFTLNTAQPFLTFNFGTVTLREDDAHGGINDNEIDHLSVTASFIFENPLGVTKTITAAGLATAGSLSDSGVDFSILWSPLTVDFGDGGQFLISLNNLAFSGTAAQIQTATITLLREPEVPVPPIDTPEPSTIALFGLGVLGLAFTRRKSGRRPA
jgi:PEP-CTERM motif